ncbi:MAG: hypothetical protein GQ559_00850 [Desulfobulbaceae bacterium]|nr:hypothetical protein [Desulfobulbaceae bacterium]
MKRFLQNLDLKKLYMTMSVLVIILLVVITALGAKQYLLYRYCEKAVSRSNKLLFQFTSMKEHINESLLTGVEINILEISKEIQSYDEDIQNITDDFLIPKEFKASFISQVDLMGLVVQLRTTKEAGQSSPEQMAKLSQMLRSINARLQRFHQTLNTYTQSLLLALHRITVGTLALVVFIVTSLLFLVNKYVSEPILQLYRTVRQTLQADEGAGKFTLNASIAELSKLVKHTAGEKHRLTNLQTCLENVRWTLPDNMQEPESWETLCQALQTNPDYFLVWVGRPEGDRNFPDPVTGCDCTSSSPIECKQAINHLIKFCRQEGSLCDTARQAAKTGSFIRASTSTEKIPETLLSSLPSFPGRVLSASFPVQHGDTLKAVITLYSATPDCFEATETAILNFLFQHLLQQQEIPQQDKPASADFFGLYRYSVLGALTAGLAHEITNISNGALNYSQALLDLADEGSTGSDERLLLDKLHYEEQKIVDLSSRINQLTWKTGPKLQKISLSDLVNSVIQMVQGQFKQDKIHIQTQLSDQLPEVTLPSMDVQIILLTLLQKAKMYLCTNLAAGSAQNMITVSTHRDLKKENTLLITIDNCAEDVHPSRESGPASPWPEIETCKVILTALDGDLIFTKDATGKQSLCSVYLPV